MRFSWTGLILAPLLVPTIFSAAVLSFQESNGALLFVGFLVLMVPSCIISYCTTIFLCLAFNVSPFLVAADDGLKGLPARSSAGHADVRPANVDGLEK
jgi:hypothetical protein